MNKLEHAVREAIELLCDGKVDTQEVVDLLESALSKDANTENTNV